MTPAGTDRFTREVRRVARQEAERVSPQMQRFRVVRRKPLTLEAVGSDFRLVDGDDDLDIARMVRQRAKVGDLVWVTTDPHGDRYVHGVSSPHGGRNEAGTGGGAEEEAEEKEAKAPEVAEEALAIAQEALAGSGGELADWLAKAGVGVIIGPGPRDPDFPFAHAIYVSPASEEPVDPQEYDQWIKPE